METKKVYTTPELNGYGEFAQLTQQSGTGTFDFIGSINSDGTTTGTVTSGADPRTSDITISGVRFGPLS